MTSHNLDHLLKLKGRNLDNSMWESTLGTLEDLDPFLFHHPILMLPHPNKEPWFELEESKHELKKCHENPY